MISPSTVFEGLHRHLLESISYLLNVEEQVSQKKAVLLCRRFLGLNLLWAHSKHQALEAKIQLSPKPAGLLLDLMTLLTLKEVH
jgi:hypothetical protein